jgi:hypothetical protein
VFIDLYYKEGRLNVSYESRENYMFCIHHDVEESFTENPGKKENLC